LGAIRAMTLCVFVLIASEFMSVSLLSHRTQQQEMGLR
jgi:predicted MFS family arabinose efflux permease